MCKNRFSLFPIGFWISQYCNKNSSWYALKDFPGPRASHCLLFFFFFQNFVEMTFQYSSIHYSVVAMQRFSLLIKSDASETRHFALTICCPYAAIWNRCGLWCEQTLKHHYKYTNNTFNSIVDNIPQSLLRACKSTFQKISLDPKSLFNILWDVRVHFFLHWRVDQHLALSTYKGHVLALAILFHHPLDCHIPFIQGVIHLSCPVRPPKTSWDLQLLLSVL